MSSKLDEQIIQLKHNIAELESQREILGDETVEAAVFPLHKKLAELESQVEPSVGMSQELPTRQRKLVTLLYMDIVGSTAMTQHLDPEDTLEIMDNALPLLAVPIEAHGGHVTRYTGDGFKAVFGDPIGKEDDPEQAIRAGLEILDVSKELAQEIEKEWGIVDFQVRIGIDTGLAALGGQTEAEDTVMGRVVNLAVRIESAAPPGGLLISHNTYRHVRGVFDVQHREPITAKGFAGPVPVYLVQAARPRAFRLRTLGVEGVETRMVGRETEFKFLQNALKKAIEEGEGQVVIVIGEAGVGKSRLLYEFQNWIELLPPPHILFYQGRGRQESQGHPYSLLRDLFAFRFQILDDDTGEDARRKVEDGFGEVYGNDEDAMMRAHIMGQMLGFDFSDSLHLRDVLNDPEQLRNRGLMYLGDYFKGLSQEGPIVIFMEDIHWADDSSLNAINQLGELTRQCPLLIVCAARHTLFERRSDWRDERPYHYHLNLPPLSEQDSRQLLFEILKLVNDIPDEMRKLVTSRAEGNPFYMEEMIKMLIEESVIIPGEDTWQIEVDQFSQMTIPSTLVGVLQARLEGLPQSERMILQQASVIGRLFWDRLVAHIQAEVGNSRDPQLVPIALTSLRGRELVYRRDESAFADAMEYMFKHDVLREVTYESVVKGMRRTYHGLVADWLIANCGDRISEYSGLIADHLLIAGREEQACQYFIQAGEYALLSYANKEAEKHFRRALSLECEEIDKANSLENLGEAIERQARHKEAIQIWSEAINLNLELENLTSVARLHAKSSRAAWMKGDHPRCLDICQEGLKWITGEPESHEVAMLLHETGRVYYFNGKPDEALEYCQKALQMAESLEDIEIQADTFTTLGTLSNQPPEAKLEALTRAVEFAHKGNNPRVESRALHNLGLIREEVTGDIHRSREDYERALAIAKRRGDLHFEHFILWGLLQLDIQYCKLSEIERGVHFSENFATDYLGTKLKAWIMFDNASLLSFQGKFQHALKLLGEGRIQLQKRGELQGLHFPYNKIADINFEIYWSGGAANWYEVEEVLNELIELGEKGLASKVSGLCLLSMANTFQGNHQEACHYLETAKQVEFDFFSPFWDSVNFTKATAYLAAAEGHWEESFAAYEDLIDTFSQKGYRWKHAHTLCDWGDALVSRGETADLEAARKLYNHSIDLYDDLEGSWYRKQVEKRLAQIT